MTTILPPEGADTPTLPSRVVPPGPYEPFMLALCVVALMVLAAETFLPVSAETKQVLGMMDTAICVVFLADFVRDLIRAENRLEYLKWGWIDLLSSIPTVDALRIGRLARIARLLRVLRGVRSTRALVSYVVARRAQSAFLAASLVSMLVVLFSSIAILQVEQEPGSNIQSPEDALWWAFVTITTVGYGDKFPVTTEGRLIAMALMTAGVGLFGTFTGFVASWFVEAEEKKVEADLDSVRSELRELRQLLEQLSHGATASSPISAADRAGPRDGELGLSTDVVVSVGDEIAGKAVAQ